MFAILVILLSSLSLKSVQAKYGDISLVCGFGSIPGGGTTIPSPYNCSTPLFQQPTAIIVINDTDINQGQRKITMLVGDINVIKVVQYQGLTDSRLLQLPVSPSQVSVSVPSVSIGQIGRFLQHPLSPSVVFYSDISFQQIYALNFTLSTTSPVQTLIAGVFAQGGYNDGAATTAKFEYPKGMAITSDAKTMYVCDSLNSLIRGIDLQSHTVSTVAGTQGSYYPPTDGTGTSAILGCLDLLMSPNNLLLYISDYGNDLIRTLDLTSFAVTTVIGHAPVSSFIDGVGLSATLMGANALMFDPHDDTQTFVYVGDYDRIRRFNVTDYSITSLTNHTSGFSLGSGISPAGSSDYGSFHFAAGIVWLAPSVIGLLDETASSIMSLDLQATVSPSSSSGVTGDPVFVTFLNGRSFQVHGEHGRVYNIFTAPNMQLNARFTFIGQKPSSNSETNQKEAPNIHQHLHHHHHRHHHHRLHRRYHHNRNHDGDDDDDDVSDHRTKRARHGHEHLPSHLRTHHTARWTHPGNYLSSLGLVLRSSTNSISGSNSRSQQVLLVHIRSHDYATGCSIFHKSMSAVDLAQHVNKDDLESVTSASTSMQAGGRACLCDDKYVVVTDVTDLVLDACSCIEFLNPHLIHVNSPATGLSFHVACSDSFVNIEHATLDIDLRLTRKTTTTTVAAAKVTTDGESHDRGGRTRHNVPLHGLLGHTYMKLARYPLGSVDQYSVDTGLFGSDFEYNLFY